MILKTKIQYLLLQLTDLTKQTKTTPLNCLQPQVVLTLC